MILEAEKLATGYDDRLVSMLGQLKLESGVQCLIVGQTGSGKTTMLKTLAGLVPPLSGTLRINGTDLFSLPAGKRDRFRARNIGYIPHNPSMIDALSVLDNLMLAPFLAGLPQDKAYAMQLLHGLNIDHLAGCKPDELTLEQKLRVAIARALVNKPKLLLADNLTACLDKPGCNAITALLQQAAQQTRAALVVTTHDERIGSSFSNIISLVKGGSE